MMKRPLSTLLVCLLLLFPTLPNRQMAPELVQVIYDDSLAAGWDDWSWAQVNLSASSPVHGGSHSIAVTVAAWQGLYLHHPAVDSLGLAYLRFYIHGGSIGGQHLNLFMNLDVNGSAENGPAIPIGPLAANDWVELEISVAALNPAGATITGLTWQDSTGGNQSTFYIDDIALVSDEDPNGPQLSDGRLTPRSLPADGVTPLVIRTRITDPQGLSDIASVTLDASGLGRAIVSLRDDGRSNDGASGDGVFGAAITVAAGTPPGDQYLLVSATDQAGHTASLPLGALNILASPGGIIPASLPNRLGWGSNAWSESPGDDWQQNSGVPWDYVYQYITYGWESWGGSFVSRFVHQAWDKGYIPMVTVYMVLGTPPECGESASCYAQKLQNSAFVNGYLASLQRAAQEATGDSAVIFNLEPDFYGFMQQFSHSSSRPPGVQPNDPASYPVALNRGGYANNLAGFGRYMVDLIHNTAPNALVAPMASLWAAPPDPHYSTDDQAIQNAGQVAAFIDAMGGAQSDLLVVEWSDRDAGSGLRPWWDDQDRNPPRPTRAMLWENALSHASSKRLLLWQVPVGNMSLNNTCDHYQDNRAAYLFNHPRDLFDAGVIGVLFGGGAECMTQVTTDGGFVAAQGAIAYADPVAPTGLQAGEVDGALVDLSWNENSEPDLWGYRVVFQDQGGMQYDLPVGRANAYSLLLPYAATWQIRLAAVDAMGNRSPLSALVTVISGVDAKRVFLPVVKR